MATSTIRNYLRCVQFEPVVYYKWAWTGNWSQAFDWQPINCQMAAAPAMSSASFAIRYGSGWWEDQVAMTDGRFLMSLAYCYVQIRLVAGSTETVVFTGLVPAEQFKLLGQSSSGKTADQIVQAFGLDYLLESRIEGAYTTRTGISAITKIDWLPSFNARYATGDVIGNRSDLATEANSKYVFSDKGNVWTNGDILDYLLKNYQTSNGPQFVFEASEDLTNLLNQLKGVYDFTNVSLRQAINTLIPRSRGIAWTYEVDDKNVYLKPISLLDEKLKLGDIEIPAGEKLYLDMWTDETQTDVSINTSINRLYDRIVVRGAKLKTCCSFSFANSNMEAGWSSAEETAYKSAASGEAGYSALSTTEKAKLNDKFRSTDRFARVFTTLRVPVGWNWQIDIDPGEPIDNQPVNPKLDETGRIDQYIEGEETLTVQAAYWNVGKRFLNTLPLKVGYDYSGSSPVDKNPINSEPEFRTLFALIKDSTGKYRYAEKQDPFAATVRPLQREFGVEVKFRPQYMAGKNHYDPDTDEPGLYTENFTTYANDYDEMIITAMIETDQIVTVEKNLNNFENKRTLFLDMPDCEFWYIIDGTVVDVNAAGDTVPHGGDSNILRDDTDKLRAVLAAALAWYGRKRCKISFTNSQLDYLPLGTIIMPRDVAGHKTGSAITNINYNFQTLSTTMITDFADLDFQAVAAAGFSPKTGPVIARRLESIDKKVTALSAQADRSPLRIEPSVMLTAVGIIWATVIRSLDYDDADKKVYNVLIGSSTSVYSGATTYNIGDGCYYEGLAYKSLIDDNTGNTPAAEWAAGTTYTTDDYAYYDSKLWKSLQDDNVDHTPAEDEWWTKDADPAPWQPQDEIHPRLSAIESAGYSVDQTDHRGTLRWYHIGDVVPVRKRDDYYYFVDDLCPVVDSNGDGSLRWNDNDQRAMAVYK